MYNFLYIHKLAYINFIQYLFISGIPCVNVNDSLCDFFAEEGECEINPVWMLPNCQLSCNVCYGEATSNMCRLDCVGN